MNRLFHLTTFTQNVSCRKSRSLITKAKSNIYLEKIIKRVILEFKNNDRIFLTTDVKNIFKQFYQVKHININLSELELSVLKCDYQIDVCVLKISDLKDAANFKRSNIKNLILINDEKINSLDILNIFDKTSPNLIIDSSFVFKYEPGMKTLKPIENFESNSDHITKEMDFSKKLLQECF